MKFTPKTEEEIAAAGILMPGIYPFEVIKAEEKPSKKGNDMIELSLRIFNDQEEHLCRDWLLESMPHKLRHAAVTLGLEDQYEAGSLVAGDFFKKEGFVKVGIQKGKPKGDGSGENYPDRNNILDYVGDVAKEQPAGEDDDLPF